MSNHAPCIAGRHYCAGPLAPINNEVCNECAEVYETMVAEGLMDFVNATETPEPDDDGDYLDRKYSR